MLLYIKATIPAYEVQLQEEADSNDAIWCKLVTGHTTVATGETLSLSQHNQTQQEKHT